MPDEARTASSQDLLGPMLAVAVTGAVLVVGAVAVSGIRPALGVAAGALVGVGNLWALGQLVRRLLAERGPRLVWGVLAGLKFVALVGVCYVALAWNVVDLAPLAIGYGALPLGVTLGQLAFGRAPREEG